MVRGVVKKKLKKLLAPYLYGDFDNVYEYGSSEWFERMFIDSEDDRWGMSYRASQKLRHKTCLEMVSSIIKEKDGEAEILDIACCLGDFTYKLYEIDNRNTIHARDISSKAISYVSAKYPYFEVKAEALPSCDFASDSMDLITCLDVLNYLNNDDREKALKNIQKVLKKGGHLLISGPVNYDEKYFTEYGFKELISKYFDIEKVEYLYNKELDLYESRILKVMNYCIRGGILVRVLKRMLGSMKRAEKLNKHTEAVFGENGRTHIFILCSKKQ